MYNRNNQLVQLVYELSDSLFFDYALRYIEHFVHELWNQYELEHSKTNYRTYIQDHLISVRKDELTTKTLFNCLTRYYPQIKNIPMPTTKDKQWKRQVIKHNEPMPISVSEEMLDPTVQDIPLTAMNQQEILLDVVCTKLPYFFQNYDIISKLVEETAFQTITPKSKIKTAFKPTSSSFMSPKRSLNKKTKIQPKSLQDIDTDIVPVTSNVTSLTTSLVNCKMRKNVSEERDMVKKGDEATSTAAFIKYLPKGEELSLDETFLCDIHNMPVTSKQTLIDLRNHIPRIQELLANAALIDNQVRAVAQAIKQESNVSSTFIVGASKSTLPEKKCVSTSTDNSPLIKFVTKSQTAVKSILRESQSSKPDVHSNEVVQQVSYPSTKVDHSTNPLPHLVPGRSPSGKTRYPKPEELEQIIKEEEEEEEITSLIKHSFSAKQSLAKELSPEKKRRTSVSISLKEQTRNYPVKNAVGLHVSNSSALSAIQLVNEVLMAVCETYPSLVIADQHQPLTKQQQRKFDSISTVSSGHLSSKKQQSQDDIQSSTHRADVCAVVSTKQQSTIPEDPHEISTESWRTLFNELFQLTPHHIRQEMCALLCHNSVKGVGSQIAFSDDEKETLTIKNAKIKDLEIGEQSSSIMMLSEHDDNSSILLSILGTIDYIVNGSGTKPNKEQKSVTMMSETGISSTTTIEFQNPANHPIRCDLSLKGTNSSPSIQQYFRILLDKFDNITINSREKFHIPIAFCPETLCRYEAKLIVKGRLPPGRTWSIENSDTSELTWSYPLQGIAYNWLDTKNDQPITIECVCGQRIEQQIEFDIDKQNLHIDEQLSDKKVSTAIEEYVIEDDNILKNCVGVQLLKRTQDENRKVDHLIFNIVYSPSKHITTDANLSLTLATGGILKYPLRFVTIDASPDDEIILEASGLNKSSTIGFRLYSPTSSPISFNAYFTQNSDQSFTISPSSGELLPVASNGTLFKISFCPSVYGRTYNATLIISADEIEWKYTVKGIPVPAYDPPRTHSSLPSVND
ncbi:unnamed protein product, partial [Didymodactylos carnosus]